MKIRRSIRELFSFPHIRVALATGAGILLLVVVLYRNPLSPKAGEPDLEKRLQTTLVTFLGENGVAPGASAYVICPALGLEWEGVAGTAAVGDTTSLTPAHTFRIASNTKTYVAAAVLRLVENGQIDLDAPLSRYIGPELDSLLKSDGYDTESMTIAQVLSHTSGLDDHTNDPRFEERIFAEPQYKWTAGEQLKALVEWRDPVGAPGEKFNYSDSGYIILGRVIERLTGQKLGPAVRQLLGFEKLGLDITRWEYMEEVRAGSGPRAHQYYGEVDVTDFHASFDLYGGGGIVTDTRELTMFMRKLLTGQVFAEGSTMAEMTTRGKSSYRLGLMVRKCRGREAFGHQGFWNTFAYHYPSLDLTIGGCILNHNAANGFELMCRLTGEVASALDKLEK